MNITNNVETYQQINAPSSSNGIEIVSPIPLPYSARSKAVLRSMISTTSKKYNMGRRTNNNVPIGETQNSPSVTESDEITLQFTKPYIMPVKHRLVDIQTRNYKAGPHTIDHPPVEPTLHIKPVTQATLMALTEPFLMAWCLESEITTVNPETSRVREDREGPYYYQYQRADHESDVQVSRNHWGY